MDNAAGALTASGSGGKRKRTGKQREERKRVAMQAQLESEGGEAAGGIQETEEAEVIEEAISVSAEPLQEEATPKIIEATGQAEPGSAAEGTDGPSLDISVTAKRVPQALKTLHPVFKQAKREETMRLVKKIRFLRTKLPATKDEVTELELQLQLLSHLSLSTLCSTHLRLKLLKHHKLKHLPSSSLSPLTDSFPVPGPSVAASSSAATPELIAKVENRVTSARVLAEAVKGVVGWVLGEEGAVLPKANARAAAKEKEGKRGNVKSAKGEKRAVGERNGKAEKDEADDEDDDEDEENGFDSDARVEFEEGAEEPDAAGWESGSVSGGEYGSDGDDSDNDSEEATVPPPKRSKATTVSASKTTTSKRAPLAKLSATSSIFLPSLASGFAAAGEDDSDPDMDYDPNGIIGKKGVAERRNRRGQRARQAIWERKYGKEAKHVKARKEEEAKAANARKGANVGGSGFKPQSQDAGWGGSGRGNEQSGAGSGFGNGAGAGSGAGAGAGAGAGVGVEARVEPGHGSSARATPTPTAAAGNKTLHPSWEAARLRRQKEESAGGQTKATKIVFE